MKTNILCHRDDIIEGKSKGFSFENTTLFGVKKDGAIYLYKNSCPHLGIELEWLEDQFLDAEDNLIQCSTHGALFLVESGKCIAGPCQGKNLSAINFSLNEKGDVYISK